MHRSLGAGRAGRVTRDMAGAAKGTIGFTTRDAIQTEQVMLAMEADGRDRLQPLYRNEWEVEGRGRSQASIGRPRA